MNLKGIFIDVNRQVVEERMIKAGDFRQISLLIECEIFTCPIIFDHNDALHVDDEGLLHLPKKGFAMKIPANENYKGSDWIFAGNGFILGADEEGESRDAKMDLDALKSMITFLDEKAIYDYANAIDL